MFILALLVLPCWKATRSAAPLMTVWLPAGSHNCRAQFHILEKEPLSQLRVGNASRLNDELARLNVCARAALGWINERLPVGSLLSEQLSHTHRIRMWHHPNPLGFNSSTNQSASNFLADGRVCQWCHVDGTFEITGCVAALTQTVQQ